jgi:hypothetical protein
MKTPVNFRPCDFSKERQSLKLGKVCGFDGIPMNVSGIFQEDLLCISHIYSITAFGLVTFRHLGRKQTHTLPKPGKNPKFAQNLRPISLLSTAGKLIENLILITTQKHIEERNLLSASQFGFRADYSTTIQCMRLADHVTLIYSNNMSTAAVFLDIEKSFDTT